MSSTRKTVAFLSLTLAILLASVSVAQTQPQIKPTYGPQKPQRARAGKSTRGVTPAQPLNRVPAGPPKGFNLPDQAKSIDQMLGFWEQKTAGIKTFQATFGRWVYDPVFGPKNDAATFSKGEIRYAKPDRGMIREIDVYKYDAKKKQDGQKWPYVQVKDAVGEHWVCDGKSVFEFDHKTKRLTETKLPPDMQGKAISEGPLPFMFGAKAATIKERYWIREEPRANKQAPYHLQLVPKRRGEDFSRVSIKLDPKRFLPTEMVLYDLNRVGRSAYSFKDLKANGTKNNLANFMGAFVSPKTPGGWTKVVHNVAGPKADQPRQARSPAAPNR